jgi:tetratricopeptide (TPR) repeat protein
MNRHLAHDLRRQRRWKQSEALLRPCLEAERRVLGPEHPETLATMYELAQALTAQHRLAEAESLVREVVTVRRRKPEAENGSRVESITLLGSILNSLNRHSEAEALFFEAVALARTIGPARDPGRIAKAVFSLGNSLTARGRYTEAEPMLHEVYQLNREAWGNGAFGFSAVGLTDPLYKNVERQDIARIVTLYERWGKPVQAAQWRFKLLDGAFPDDPFASPSATETSVRAADHSLPVGWGPMGKISSDWEIGVDRAVVHSGKASLAIKIARVLTQVPRGALQIIRADDYRGKRWRLSTFVKAERVSIACQVFMRVDGKDRLALASDSMADRPIVGTTNWERHEIVLDVPEAADEVRFGCFLVGRRQVWIDDFVLEPVGQDVKTTGAKAMPVDRKTAVRANRPRAPRNLGFED